MPGPTESGFEDAITASLVANGGYLAPVKIGLIHDSPPDLDLATGLDTAELLTFIGATQPKEWEKVRRSHSSPEEAQQSFIARLAKELDRRGTVDVLRHGLTYAGHETAEFRLAYFRPASGLNPALEKRYQANRLTVMRQVPYQPGSTKTLDLALFVNGIPVATAELKTPLSGQTYKDAIKQYRKDRDPKAPLLRRAVVHFAVDTEQVFMSTRLAGAKTLFLPFNRGNNQGAGNPARDGYRTGYLWEDVWQRDTWLDLLARFVHNDPASKNTIFPRYHQWDAVLRLVDDARSNGAGQSYLVQHSAGSGKSNTIAWLAHRLSSLHAGDDKVFDKVVVITDRRVLDRQLQETIYQFEHAHGVVEKIDEDSAQLAAALKGERARIIITTLQKFPFVMRHVDALKSRTYAVIVDEAHSSQTGDAAVEMKKVLGSAGASTGTGPPTGPGSGPLTSAGDAELPDPIEDALAAAVAARGRQPNLSFFAFTATPKGRTLGLFGVKNPGTGKHQPFHLYSMRQAIEEEFILDVLDNYVTYDTYFKIDKAITDDPELDSARARTAIARFVSLHESNLAQRAEVIIEHFRQHIRTGLAGQAKAMVVTASRLHALHYKWALDKYCREHGIGDVSTFVAFSGKLTVDDVDWTEAKINGFPDSQTPAQFDTDAGQILVVAEKYQTGFDQPKLCAMYVDKTLTGLAAVQTLSRLNRRADGKKTFVLDFRNSVKDIQEAFAPWYVRTESPPTDPHLLYDTHAELGPFGVVASEEVESVVSLLLTDANKNHERINSGLQPAVDRFRALEVGQQDDFRDVLTRFVRIYRFLSQIVSFTDVKLERDYLFCRALSRLIKREPGTGFDLGDAVELTHLAMEKTFAGDGSIDVGDGEVITIYDGAGRRRDPGELPLSQIIAAINERFGVNISDTDRLLTDQVANDLVSDPKVQAEAAANDETSFGVGRDKSFTQALTNRLNDNEKFAFELLDNPELREAVVAQYWPDIYKRARVARQHTSPIGDLIGPDREDRFLEYKSTMRWDIRRGEKANYIEDAIIKTIAGFANSPYGGTLLVGVSDDGGIHGLEDDYATFSKRGEQGDHDLWGQHLKNLLQRLGKYAASLVDWTFFSIDGSDIARVCVDSSDHPVFEAKGDRQVFWWRSPVSTDAVNDEQDRDRIIARRWG